MDSPHHYPTVGRANLTFAGPRHCYHLHMYNMDRDYFSVHPNWPLCDSPGKAKISQLNQLERNFPENMSIEH